MKKKFNITEDELVELLKDGNEKGLEVLYQNYSKALYNVIFQILHSEELAEETLQDSFIKIWRNAQSYDHSKGTIFTWMLNICRNSAIDKTRSKEFKNDNQNRLPENSVNTREAETGFNPDHIGLNKMIEKLKPELRDVVYLLFIRGYSQQSAAEFLKIPLGTVKTRSRNAILELRKYFIIILSILHIINSY